jgi:hypothetical protein
VGSRREERFAVDDLRLAALERDRAPLFLLAEHAVDGRAGGPGDLAELLLSATTPSSSA